MKPTVSIRNKDIPFSSLLSLSFRLVLLLFIANDLVVVESVVNRLLAISLFSETSTT
jgi:hypothetical protein